MGTTFKDCLIRHLSTNEFDLLFINLIKGRGFTGAMNYINSYYTENYKPHNIIDMAFHWAGTPEGHDYWSGIRKRLLNIIEN